MSELKTRITKIITLIVFLTISCLAWEKNIGSTRKNQSIIITLKDDNLDPQVHGDIAFVVGKHAKKCRAFSRICPHLGCKIEADYDGKCFICPCHGSKFSLTGEPIQGPAIERLIEYRCEVINHRTAIQVYLNDK